MRGQLRLYLETSIDKGAAAKPNPGQTVLHRLNRAEYGRDSRLVLAGCGCHVVPSGGLRGLRIRQYCRCVDHVAGADGSLPFCCPGRSPISRLQYPNYSDARDVRVRSDLSQTTTSKTLPIGETVAGILIRYNFPG